MNCIHIEYLADFPQYTSLAAEWRYIEWSTFNPELTWDFLNDSMKRHLNRSELPLTLLAFNKSDLVGMVSLRKYDLKDHENMTPWVASLYVVPEYRKQGIGELLVKAAEAKARILNYKKIFLYSFNHLLETWYNKLGYKKIEEGNVYGNPIYVMSKFLIE
ncbi:MAG: GNAT family N-acetyltransferase [Alphaproteobacteria bacterium]|nr:GNAT family N-acetyltransferase [Alphaproteobacteria bacterium]